MFAFCPHIFGPTHETDVFLIPYYCFHTHLPHIFLKPPTLKNSCYWITSPVSLPLTKEFQVISSHFYMTLPSGSLSLSSAQLF